MGRLRSRRGIAALGALGVAALALGIILGTGLTGSSQGASPAAKVSGATTVQRRDLVATDTESGTLGYANSQTVYNRISGTVTWLPQVGQLIKPGHALYYVDNQPVTLFGGATPAYRTLSSGVSNGPDVKELNGDLVEMGFDPNHQITVNDTWQAGTTDAVNRWQAALGESQTGSITLGQIVFLPGIQRVTTVDAVLGSNGSSSSGAGSGTGSTSTTAGIADPHPVFASYVTTTPTTSTTPSTSTTSKSRCQPSTKIKAGSQKSCTPSTQAALVALLKAETAELQKTLASSARGAAGSGGSGGSGAARGGGGGGGSGSGSGSASSAGSSAQPILQTTSNQLNVVVDLDATKQSEAVVGEPVTVQMPSGDVVNGTITQVSPIAQSSSSSSGSGSGGSGSGAGGSSSSTPSATIPVTIELHGRLPSSGLDQAAVSVNFQQQKATGVLSVPVTALLATAGGGYAVQEAAPPHRLIPITPGLFAAGYVQISGSQIYPGLQVTDSQG